LLVLKQNYSIELQRVVSALLSGKHSSAQLCQHPLLAERIHDELDTALAAADALHSHLRAEYENGRVARLLLKLGMVNERPPGPAGDWSETGDQYVLKLFRDYVFHQQDADSGLPVLDAGHVLAALGKLDAGDPEEILLSSRDGKDLLVVSFADVQR
jgi:PAB-dependent poly(A)-specific ribonuclease subunit 3